MIPVDTTGRVSIRTDILPEDLDEESTLLDNPRIVQGYPNITIDQDMSGLNELGKAKLKNICYIT